MNQRLPAFLQSVQPAGQVGSGFVDSIQSGVTDVNRSMPGIPVGMTANGDGTYTDSSGTTFDSQGRALTPPPPVPMGPPPGGSLTSGPDAAPIPDVATSAADAGMAPSDQQALFDDVSSVLGTTGATITSVINSGNAVQIQQLQDSTAAQIAALNLQAARNQAAGNIQLAQQNAAQSARLAQFQAAFLTSAGSKTGLYIVGGVIILGIIGAFVYFGASTRSARKNPSQTQALTVAEREIARQHLKSRRGKSSAGGFKTGDRVSYRGVSYFVYDFDGKPSSPYGATATLLSSDGVRLVRDVDIGDLR